MSDLQKIEVEDIRKGQRILMVTNRQICLGAVRAEPSIYEACSDGYSNGSTATLSSYFLLKDVPTPPPFEVPWGMAQRDKDGLVWDFRTGKDIWGNVATVEGTAMDAEDAARSVPFTRLYTVQELAGAIERVAGKPTDLSRQLLHMQEVGDV